MAIIKHIEQIEKIVGVYSDVDLSQIEVFLEEVEQEYIVELLGETFYDLLEEKKIYEGDEEKLVRQIAKPVVTLAFLKAIPQLNVGISAQGLVVTNSDGVAPASEVRTVDLKRSFLDLGHRRIDGLIRYLEKNKAKYDELELPIFGDKTSHFLKNADEFDEVIRIEKNRYVFLKMLPLIRDNERKVIKKVFGETLYDLIITSFKDAAGLAVTYKPLVPFVRDFLAFQTYADSLIDLGLLVDDRGVTVFNSNYAETVNVRKPADKNDVSEIKRRNEEKAKDALNELIDYLNTNVDAFVDFKESSFYKKVTAGDEDTTAGKPMVGDGFVGF